MGIFDKNVNTNPPAVKPAKTPATTFAAARSNLLLVVAFTAVNIILRLSSADMYFLFSASVPMAFLDLATVFESNTALVVGAVLAAVCVGLYLLCWLLSKKHRGWMVVALVMFVLDTLALFLLYEPMSVITDVLIHAWVLYYLITGTVAMVKMKNQPEEPAVEEIPAEEIAAIPEATPVEAPVAPVEQPVAPAQVMVNGEPVEE